MEKRIIEYREGEKGEVEIEIEAYAMTEEEHTEVFAYLRKKSCVFTYIDAESILGRIHCGGHDEAMKILSEMKAKGWRWV